jgi:hypothetical protein
MNLGCCGPEKGRFVAESSLRHLGGESAVSARCVRGQCRRPRVCSVAACCVVRVRDAYTGRADGLRCVELLPSQVRAAAVMNSRRERSCCWYCCYWSYRWSYWNSSSCCWRPVFLFRCRWATCGPVGGVAEVVRAGWLAPVLEFRQPSGELQCIKTACARYAVAGVFGYNEIYLSVTPGS